MSKKKFYAVRKGRKPGIYTTWSECQKQTNGYSGAEFKSFKTLKEAKDYINDLSNDDFKEEDGFNIIKAYVDGSFDETTNTFSYGIVFIYDDKIRIDYGKSNVLKYAEMRNVAGELLGAIKAMEFAYDNRFQFDKLLIYYDYEGIEKWCTGAWDAKKEGTKEYVGLYNEFSRDIEVQFIKVKAHSGDKYNEIADVLAKYALSSDIYSIVKNIEYDECDCFDLSELESIQRVKMTTEECIKILREICDSLGIKIIIKDENNVQNNKDIVIDIVKNKLSSKIQLHNTPNGITINLMQGKNRELNLIIMYELKNSGKIIKVETKCYSYKNLSEEQINEAVNSLKLFNDDSDFELIDKNKSNNNEKYKYWFEIISKNSNEKVTIHIYNNNTLEIRGKRYLLWEDVCYIIEKSIGVELDDIIGRINVSIDLEFKHDNLDACDNELRKKLNINLIEDFMNSYDYDVILSVMALFDHKPKLPDYGVFIDPLTRAFEGYFKSVIIRIGLDKTINLKRKDWKFNKLFYDSGVKFATLKEEYHNILCKDKPLRDKQLDVLSEMCEKVWKIRNPINHSGPIPPITYNNYNDALEVFNDIIDLINRSYEILI